MTSISFKCLLINLAFLGGKFSMTGCAGIGSPPPPTTRPSVAHCACPVLWRLGFAAVPMDGSLFEGFSKWIWVENINGVLRGESEKKV